MPNFIWSLFFFPNALFVVCLCFLFKAGGFFKGRNFRSSWSPWRKRWRKRSWWIKGTFDFSSLELSWSLLVLLDPNWNAKLGLKKWSISFNLLFQDSFIHNCLILFLSLLSQISHKGTLVGSLWCNLGKTNEPFAQDAGGSLLLSTQCIGREHHFQCHVSTLQAQSLAGLCLLHARACSTGTSIRKVPPEFSTLLKNTCQLACMILQIVCYKAAEQTCEKAGDMEILFQGTAA